VLDAAVQKVANLLVQAFVGCGLESAAGVVDRASLEVSHCSDRNYSDRSNNPDAGLVLKAVR
jgi:hypothetical protein